MKMRTSNLKMSYGRLTFKNTLTALVLSGIFMFTSCNNNDDGPTPAVETELGYVLHTNSAGIFIQVSDSLFSGTINPTDFTNAVQVAGDGNIGRHGGKAFNGNYYADLSQAGDVGIQKYVRNESGNLEGAGFISTGADIRSSSFFDIASETKGYYLDPGRSTSALQVFDPSSMQRTGQIDFPSEVTQYNTGDVARINMATFVKVNGNLVYTQIEFYNADGSLAYDSTFVLAFNTMTDSFEELLIYPTALILANPPNYDVVTVDSNGDMYLMGILAKETALGNFSSTYVACIRSGATSFDTSFGTDGLFDFSGIIENPGTGNGFVLTFFGGNMQDGKLYIRIKSNEVLEFAQLADTDIDAYVVDMNTLTGFKIQDIPSSSIGANSFCAPQIIDGGVFYPVSSDDFQGFYRYDIATGEVTQAITLASGKPVQLAKLETTE